MGTFLFRYASLRAVLRTARFAVAVKVRANDPLECALDAFLIADSIAIRSMLFSRLW